MTFTLEGMGVSERLAELGQVLDQLCATYAAAEAIAHNGAGADLLESEGPVRELLIALRGAEPVIARTLPDALGRLHSAAQAALQHLGNERQRIQTAERVRDEAARALAATRAAEQAEVSRIRDLLARHPEPAGRRR